MRVCSRLSLEGDSGQSSKGMRLGSDTEYSGSICRNVAIIEIAMAKSREPLATADKYMLRDAVDKIAAAGLSADKSLRSSE